MSLTAQNQTSKQTYRQNTDKQFETTVPSSFKANRLFSELTVYKLKHEHGTPIPSPKQKKEREKKEEE